MIELPFETRLFPMTIPKNVVLIRIVDDPLAEISRAILAGEELPRWTPGEQPITWPASYWKEYAASVNG